MGPHGMAQVFPVVRSITVCDYITVDYGGRAGRPERVSLEGIAATIRIPEGPSFPFSRDLRVFVQLTEARGTAAIGLTILSASTGEAIYSSDDRRVEFGTDPLAVRGFPFRIRRVPFPRADYYSVQFRYNGVVVAEQTVRVIGGEP